MGNAQVVKLSAHPVRSSILSFEIGGVLDHCEVGLGDAVAPISYESLIDRVAQSGTVAGDASRLSGDAARVVGLTKQFTRNADRRAALHSAVNTRQNIVFAKYANAAQADLQCAKWRSETSPHRLSASRVRAFYYAGHDDSRRPPGQT